MYLLIIPNFNILGWIIPLTCPSNVFTACCSAWENTVSYRWTEKIKTTWCVFDIPANGWEDEGEVRTRGSGGVLRRRRWRNKDAWRRVKFTVYGIFAAVCIDVYASIFYSRWVWPVEGLEGACSLLEGLWRCCSDNKNATVKHMLMVQWMRTLM